MLIFGVVVQMVIGSSFLQLDCALSAKPAWSAQVEYVLPGCDFHRNSPDSNVSIRVDQRGRLSIRDKKGRSLGTIGSIEPPAMMSWSPLSSALFINDGEGSGMTSTLRVWKRSAGSFVEDKRFQRSVVGMFRKEKQCAASAYDPDVWGLGWSPDGQHLYVLVMPTVHESCGEGGSFLTVVLSVQTASIVEQLSEDASRQRFKTLLPPNVGSPKKRF